EAGLPATPIWPRWVPTRCGSRIISVGRLWSPNLTLRMLARWPFTTATEITTLGYGRRFMRWVLVSMVILRRCLWTTSVSRMKYGNRGTTPSTTGAPRLDVGCGRWIAIGCRAPKNGRFGWHRTNKLEY